MIRKLSDLDSRELGTLFEVEYEMLPILHSVGIMLDEQKIRSEILSKPDQYVLFTESDKGFVGLLRFEYQDEDIFVTSLNIRRQTRVFLRTLYENFSELEFIKLRSTVQLTNKASISFHLKLGLKEVSRNEKVIRYEVKRDKLLEALEFYSARASV